MPEAGLEWLSGLYYLCEDIIFLNSGNFTAELFVKSLFFFLGRKDNCLENYSVSMYKTNSKVAFYG